MHQDWAGNTITVDTADTAQGVADFVEGLLSYETKAANVLQAAEAEPDSPIANAYAGLLHLFLETPAAAGLARPWLERARANASRATERERMTLALAEAWADGDIARVIAVGREGVAAHPNDLVLAKITQYHQFGIGDAPGMLSTGLAVADHRPDICHVHGMVAFGYEQCHLLGDAEAAATRAIALKRKEPWAHHALAHVHLTQGRIDEGRLFLEEMADSWTNLNSFMLTHNWWHYALFAISQGDMTSALRAYDERCWGVDKSYSQDQIGAVSLLARLELAGVDVGARWDDVGEWLAGRKDDFVSGFLALQYIYGLARAGRPEADEMLEGFRQTARSDRQDAAVWAEVAEPAARGMVAHARGDWEGAVKALGPVLNRIWETGGSHAQRDLFDQVWLDALIRSGRLVAAQQALEMRRGFEPDSVPTNRHLARIYQDLALPGMASQAEARVRAQLLDH